MSISLMLEGLKVKDAKRSIKISPCELDLKTAKRGNPKCCVAAQALKRDNRIEKVHVYRSRTFIKFKKDNFYTRFSTPSRLAANTVTFDKARVFDITEDYTFGPICPSHKKEYYQAHPRKKAAKRDGSKPRRRLTAMANVRGVAHLQRA